MFPSFQWPLLPTNITLIQVKSVCVFVQGRWGPFRLQAPCLFCFFHLCNASLFSFHSNMVINLAWVCPQLGLLVNSFQKLIHSFKILSVQTNRSLPIQQIQNIKKDMYKTWQTPVACFKDTCITGWLFPWVWPATGLKYLLPICSVFWSVFSLSIPTPMLHGVKRRELTFTHLLPHPLCNIQSLLFSISP